MCFLNSQHLQRRTGKKNSNDMESLTSLPADGPFTGRAYIRRGLKPEYFFCLLVAGPITGRAYKGGGGGVITEILRYINDGSKAILGFEI